MRRLWVVAAALGLVVGLVVGFSVGARFWIRPWNPAWVEAWGTWVGAGLSAAILVWLAVRSEKHARELETARQAREEELAVRSEKLAKELEAKRQARDDDEARQREQIEADRVICNAWLADYRTEEDGTRVAGAVAVTVTNGAGGVLSDVECAMQFGGIGQVLLSNALAPDERIDPTLPAKRPIRLSATDDHEVRRRVLFKFWLNGMLWFRHPADRQAVRAQDLD